MSERLAHAWEGQNSVLQNGSTFAPCIALTDPDVPLVEFCTMWQLKFLRKWRGKCLITFLTVKT